MIEKKVLKVAWAPQSWSHPANSTKVAFSTQKSLTHPCPLSQASLFKLPCRLEQILCWTQLKGIVFLEQDNALNQESSLTWKKTRLEIELDAQPRPFGGSTVHMVPQRNLTISTCFDEP